MPENQADPCLGAPPRPPRCPAPVRAKPGDATSHGLPCSQEPSTVLPAGPRRGGHLLCQQHREALGWASGLQPHPHPGPPGPSPRAGSGLSWPHALHQTGHPGLEGAWSPVESRGHAGRFPGWGWASSGAIQTVAGEKGPCERSLCPASRRPCRPCPCSWDAALLFTVTTSAATRGASGG